MPGNSQDYIEEDSLHNAKKRKWSVSPNKSTSANPSNSHSNDAEENDDLPQPYNAQALQPAKRRAISPAEQPRRQKKPGTRNRLTESDREAIRQRQIDRERESLAATEEAAAALDRQRGINDVVRQHYNNVPERGRDWRRTDSKIKGLRSFNNWIKSCIIQKFSVDEDHVPGSRERGQSSGNELLVLDVGCGKGGDLMKWQQAPQPVQLYVGLDPADISIDQAKARFRSMGSGGGRGGGRGGYSRRPQPPPFEGRFYVKDCFGESIEDLEIIRQVGFDPSPMNRRGFDVVSMMFAMHYAFETEQKARNMLRNVAGALKKGGRFIGCIPNSDVISEQVRKFNARMEEKKKSKREAKAAQTKAGETDSADAPAATPTDGQPDSNNKDNEDDGEVEEGEAEETAEWGNSIYRVRFPNETPTDGIFRPAFGWKYNFFLDEAVEEVPEYVVPWEAFRALADDYNLELQWYKPFMDVWESECNDPVLGPLSERMGVRQRGGGPLLVTKEETDAASFYLAFCFYKV